MPKLPEDYLERVYAGVLGKLIGVYLGRPFEGWTHAKILEQLGHIEYFVHEKLDVPLVVTDDDVSGTFIFPRALLEHGISADITSEDIGKTWLNNVIEGRTIFWWGGNGVSTEHTAYLNLKKGIPAPKSGSIETNGKTVAEQIGAQIFIDGWALVAPGNPALAARLAGAAGKVSHDGESVHAAVLFAAMEAEAFVSKDIDHLLNTGLGFIPGDSLVAKLIEDIRHWAIEDEDWLKTRDRIEFEYGYHKFCGNCHVIPNHGIMTLALIYGGHSFHEAMHIVNTCGWDTDCNSGNIACLVAIMHGLQAFEEGPDWRGPLADRALISSADAGYSINNAARIAYDLTNMGRQLAGEQPLPPPKDGAQFHFTLPGSVQGFEATRHSLMPDIIRVQQRQDSEGRTALAICLKGLTKAAGSFQVTTPTFTPPDIVKMKTYELAASPLIYPGQTVETLLRADVENTGPVNVCFGLEVYGTDDKLELKKSPAFVILGPGEERTLSWTINDDMNYQPIQRLGISISASQGHVSGRIDMSYLRWSGTPQLTLRRPVDAGKAHFWRRAWVNGVSHMQRWGSSSFVLAQNDNTPGLLAYGTREWCDLRVEARGCMTSLAAEVGLAVRVQGLRRYYALVLQRDGRVSIVKARDGVRTALCTVNCPWILDKAYTLVVEVDGPRITASVQGLVNLEASDSDYDNGGIGLVVTDGAFTVDEVQVGSARGKTKVKIKRNSVQ